MKNITWAIFICAFILFRPYQLQKSGCIYTGDDNSYLAHATSLVFFQFPSYSKEYFLNGKGVPMHPMGPALLACPFVFCASLLDRVFGAEIVSKRTEANVYGSWTAFGFIISSAFFLWMICLLLYRGLRFYFEPRISSLTVILIVLLQGVPLFAFRRPVFSHIYEMFLQSIFVFILLRLNSAGGFILSAKSPKIFREAVFVGLLIGLITLVRLNNIIMALAWPIILFTFYYPRIGWGRIVKMAGVSYLTMGALIFIFQIFPIIYLHDMNRYQGYESNDFVSNLLILYNPVFYIKRLARLIWGLDWGLIFTAPFTLLGLFFLVKIKEDKVCRSLKWLLIPLAVNLYVVLACREQGGWYGHRYLIFSLIPVIAYPVAWALALAGKNNRYLYYAIIFMALLPVFSMLSFEANNSNLTLKLIDQGFGARDYGNNVFQLEIYKTMLTTPVQFVFGILKGGLLYIVYQLSTVLGLNKYLPAVIMDKYAIFELPAFIKTLFIYLLPFGLLFIYNKWTRVK